MSDTPPELLIALSGDWWWYAAFYNAQFYRPDPKPGHAPSLPMARGYQFQVRANDGRPMGEITFTGANENTTVSIVSTSHEYDQYWNDIRGLLEAFAGGARDIRRSSVGITVDEVIAAYERARAEGQRISLKELCEYAGVSYAYVRKRRSERGSNKKG